MSLKFIKNSKRIIRNDQNVLLPQIQAIQKSFEELFKHITFFSVGLVGQEINMKKIILRCRRHVNLSRESNFS